MEIPIVDTPTDFVPCNLNIFVSLDQYLLQISLWIIILCEFFFLNELIFDVQELVLDNS